ncbi:MAG: ubiquinol-cytochrome c reductase iron-sulfur subunit, partial [Mycobacterium sp.]
SSPHGPEAAVVVAERVPGTPIVSRRRVLQTSFWTGIGAVLAGMGACGLDIIYPSTVTGFGGTVAVPKSAIPPPGQKAQIPAGRFWLVNLTAEQGGPGLLALWWRCPHLGCTVPWRPSFAWPDPSSGQIKLGWFRCPCHGSTYSDAGVRVFGPAPRSMDTMAISVTGTGDLSVNTGSRTNGGPDNPDRAVLV